MHFVGGGAARPGGAFPQPRQRSPRCWPSVRAYFERGDYLADVSEAVGDARDAGALGAKLTGAGGGGCVIALPGAREAEVMEAFAREGARAWTVEVR